MPIIQFRVIYYLTFHYSGIFPTFVSVHFKILCCLFSSVLREWKFALFLHVLKPSFQIPSLNHLSHSCLHIALGHSVLYITHLLVASLKTEKSDYLLRHVCPSAWNISALTRWIFMKFDICVFFEKLSRISNMNKGYSAWTQLDIFYLISLGSS